MPRSTARPGRRALTAAAGGARLTAPDAGREADAGRLAGRRTARMAEHGGEVADLLVIFGITGDLARKMTFRALYRLERRRLLDRPATSAPGHRCDIADPGYRRRGTAHPTPATSPPRDRAGVHDPRDRGSCRIRLGPLPADLPRRRSLGSSCSARRRVGRRVDGHRGPGNEYFPG